jgi:hypothetical protein
MTDADKRGERERLTPRERTAASIAAVVLLVIAVWMILDPPDRTVALEGCRSAAEGCLVTVDGDLTTIAAAFIALAAAAGLIGLLGVRFTSVKAGGVELSKYEEKTAGLPTAVPQPPLGGDEEGGIDTQGVESPVRVEIHPGLGTELGIVPVAVASLDSPMSESQATFLRDYQTALRNGRKGWFLTHILGPAKSPRQKYSVAIKVTPHRSATGEVKAARFFFGRAWGYRVFEGERGADDRFGITTEAYGPFLALCEVEFTTGERVLLDHYCDFEMGALIGE